ncbi:MAG: PilZ domain-containing protein [Pseudomonadota bacterium]
MAIPPLKIEGTPPKRERRKYPRIEARIKVTFRNMAELIQEYTRNISVGGIFVKTDRPLDPNATIDLTLEYPDQKGEFTLKGEVVRLIAMSHPSEPDKQIYGAGIRFVKPDAAMIAAIERMIANAKPGEVD